MIIGWEIYPVRVFRKSDGALVKNSKEKSLLWYCVYYCGHIISAFATEKYAKEAIEILEFELMMNPYVDLQELVRYMAPEEILQAQKEKHG